MTFYGPETNDRSYHGLLKQTVVLVGGSSSRAAVHLTTSVALEQVIAW